MNARRKRDFLKTQLIESKELLAGVEDHPLMANAFQERVEELEEEIAELPIGQKEPRTVLFFSGDPVQGSIGIDASFAARVLGPFQNIVATEHAHRWHGIVGSRGRRVGEAESRLMITGLPRGSFGFELTKADNDELFEEDQLAETLAHVTRLLESASRSDEDFAGELDEASPRSIPSLKDFLSVVSQGKAGLSVESGDLRCSLSPNQAVEAFERVSGTVTNDETIEEIGTFNGVLLDSWKFDFATQDGRKISGKLADEITEEGAVEIGRDFLKKKCVATFEKTTVLFKNGRIRTTHKLLGLKTL